MLRNHNHSLFPAKLITFIYENPFPQDNKPPREDTPLATYQTIPQTCVNIPYSRHICGLLRGECFITEPLPRLCGTHSNTEMWACWRERACVRSVLRTTVRAFCVPWPCTRSPPMCGRACLPANGRQVCWFPLYARKSVGFGHLSS